jgi:hypothetical protein
VAENTRNNCVESISSAFTRARDLLPDKLIDFGSDVTITGGGVIGFGANFQLANSFVLDAAGNADAVFIFSATTLSLEVSGNIQMSLVGEAKAENVFWILKGLKTFGKEPLYGNFLVESTISIARDGKIFGRLLGQNDVTCTTICTVEPQPTAAPTVAPTAAPSITPTVTPTAGPTVAPTDAPTGEPTISPTVAPTDAPTGGPTISPTVAPTAAPSGGPTISPTVAPTAAPSGGPTNKPSMAPSAAPEESCGLFHHGCK